MTTTLTKDPRFGAITRVFGPSPLWAVCGALHKVLVATVSGGQVVFSGESADLGAEVLAVNTGTSPNCHVLTANGLTFVTNTSTPQIVSQVLFNPGGGTWLHMFGGVFLATPWAKGGIQVVHGTTGAIIASHLSGMQSSQFAAADSSTDRLWVVDQLNASLSTFTVSSTTGAITFMGKIRAPNCRDVVKIVVDVDEESLFVVCRNRILRFNIPTTSDTPVFAQDYGAAAVPYVDFVVLEADKYWVSQATSLLPSPLDLYYGPMLGVWETSTEELIVAAPQSSLWTVNNVVPYYTAETIEETLPVAPPVTTPPPPVVAPLPPVITSSLTASVTEDTLFSYTITATGASPIYYDVVSPPSWLTSINHITGAISGVPPDPSTVNITITATNAGGTDTETLIVTVEPAIAPLSAVSVGSQVTHVKTVGNLVYVYGYFTSVTDASGTITRNRGACLNLTTGLWTGFNPNIVGQVLGSCHDPATNSLYLAGTMTTFNGVSRSYVAKVDATTGVLDTGWLPTPNGNCVDAALIDGSIFIAGSFTSVSASSRTRLVRLNKATGAVESWNPTTTSTLTSDPYRIYPSGSSIVVFGGSVTAPDASRTFTGVGVNSAPYANGTTTWGLTDTGQAIGTKAAVVRSGVAFFSFSPTSVTTFIQPAFGTSRTRAAAVTAVGGSLLSWAPALPSAANCMEADETGVYIGGAFASINGDTGKRFLGKVDASSGATISGFTVTFSSGLAIVDSLSVSGEALCLGGNWGGNVNGVAKAYFAVVNRNTGALY